MEQEALQELPDSQGHESLIVSPGEVAQWKGTLSPERERPKRRNLTLETTTFSAAERRFGVDDPVVAEQDPHTPANRSERAC